MTRIETMTIKEVSYTFKLLKLMGYPEFLVKAYLEMKI